MTSKMIRLSDKAAKNGLEILRSQDQRGYSDEVAYLIKEELKRRGIVVTSADSQLQQPNQN